MDSYDYQRTGSIAVVGMACRFPGAGNVEDYWWNLQNGIESITAFSPEELMAAGVDPERVKDPNYVRAAPLLKKSDWFDADFFEYSHREAELMDPSQRVFLELAWHALEHAGYGGSSRIPAVGVFAGSGGIMNSYLLSNTHFHPILVGATAGMEHVGNDKDYLCTRVSHKLNLKGPSLTVQTACSTSLVAVHLACQSLLNMECDMALAGGVNIRVPQIAGYMIGECPMHSVDGHCRPFDREATGTVFGSGVGLVVLKPLRQAVADRDCIHGVIRGSAVHNDGGGKLSYWAASADGLAETVAEA
ncbi:MAG: polyketide synthase, partial [Desulfobacteraceae bacterium]|nr:polyketide synthase [Desulfobacteraceae bacterium]